MICDGCFVIQIRDVRTEQLLCFVRHYVATTVQFQQLRGKAVEINLTFTEYTHKNGVSFWAGYFRIRAFVFLTVVAIIVSSRNVSTPRL